MSNLSQSPRAFAGSIAKIRVAAASNANGLSIIENKLPYGYGPPLHVHNTQDETFHVLRGRIRFEVGDETFVARAGDILTAPKNVSHRFLVESEEGAVALVITIGSDFETFVMEASSPIAVDTLQALPPVTEKDIETLGQAASRNGIELIGPPLAIAAARAVAA